MIPIIVGIGAFLAAHMGLAAFNATDPYALRWQEMKVRRDFLRAHPDVSSEHTTTELLLPEGFLDALDDLAHGRVTSKKLDTIDLVIDGIGKVHQCESWKKALLFQNQGEDLISPLVKLAQVKSGASGESYSPEQPEQLLNVLKAAMTAAKVMKGRILCQTSK